MRNTRYKYYQPNEKDVKDQYGDCVVRSLAKVRNADWLTIYDELVPIARKSSACQTENRHTNNT